MQEEGTFELSMQEFYYFLESRVYGHSDRNDPSFIES